MEVGINRVHIKTRRGKAVRVARESYSRPAALLSLPSLTPRLTPILILHSKALPLFLSLSAPVPVSTALSVLSYTSIDAFRAVSSRVLIRKLRKLIINDYTHLAKDSDQAGIVLFPDRFVKETKTKPNEDESHSLLLLAEFHAKFVKCPIIIVGSPTTLSVGSDQITFCSLSRALKLLLLDSLSSEIQKLEDLISSSDEKATTVDSGSNFYQPYLPMAVCESGIRSGTIVKGMIKLVKSKPKVGKVEVVLHGELTKVKICGEQAFNRALENDCVYIKLQKIRKLEDAVDGFRQLDDDKELGEDFADHFEELENEDSVQPGESSEELSGVVVAIEPRNTKSYVCTIQDNSSSSVGDDFLFVPVNVKVPKIRVRTKHALELTMKRVVVVIDSWDASSQYPDGHITRVLGPSSDLSVEAQALLLEHNLFHVKFTTDFLLQWSSLLPTRDWSADEEMSLEKMKGISRRDLRKSHPNVFSIDPVGCVDIDDAFSVREVSDSIVEVGVHIADVSTFVTTGSPIDIEARTRATTVYLADRRLNMLPEVLSEGVCSLHEDQDRFAMSVLWKFDRRNNWKVVEEPWAGRSVIKSKAALTYEDAQLALDGNKKKSSSKAWFLRKDIEVLTLGARVLRTFRQQYGCLELESFEAVYEQEKAGSETEKEEDETHSVVAEWMIYANQYVATRIFKIFPDKALLRYHPAPVLAKVQELANSLRKAGVILDCSSAKALSTSLDRLSRDFDLTVVKLVRGLLTRTMSPAKYVSSGSLLLQGSDTMRHYGLGLDLYTHFTSPIRRYADIVVHRLLVLSLKELSSSGSSEIVNNTELQKICDHLNSQNRAAKYAQRVSKEIFLRLYLKLKAVDVSGKFVETGILRSISRQKLELVLPRLGIFDAIGVPSNGILKFRSSRSDSSEVEFKIQVEDSVLMVSTDYDKQLEYNVFDQVFVEIEVSHTPYRIGMLSLKMKLVAQKPPKGSFSKENVLGVQDFVTAVPETSEEPLKLKAEVEVKSEVGRQRIRIGRTKIPVSPSPCDLVHKASRFSFRPPSN